MKTHRSNSTAGMPSDKRASVLNCGSPLPLWHCGDKDENEQKAAAVQNLADVCTLNL